MGDAPSLKGITYVYSLDTKLFFRMGAHNFTLTYDGKFSDISMPINDISLVIKASVPTVVCEDKAMINLGVVSEFVKNKEGHIVEIIPKNNRMEVKLDYKENTHKDYEAFMEKQIYG